MTNSELNQIKKILNLSGIEEYYYIPGSVRVVFKRGKGYINSPLFKRFTLGSKKYKYSFDILKNTDYVVCIYTVYY